MSATADQRQAALSKANSDRLARANFHQSLDGTDDFHTVAELLRDPPAWAASVRVWDLLTWIRGVGKGRGGRELVIHAWLHEAQVMGDYMKVGQMSERQRLALADAVEAY